MISSTLYDLETTITPTNSDETARTFLPSELYLPEALRDTEFFRDICLLLDYLQNSIKDYSNPKYAMIEQAYKDIAFKYKDIMQVSEESLKAMLIENGFSAILETLELSLEQLQMFVLYLPLLKIMKGTDEGYKLLLSLITFDYEIETWLDNPQELDEYTYNLKFITILNTGFDSNIVKKFVKFSRSYVYPVLKNVMVQVMYRSFDPIVCGFIQMIVRIRVECSDEPS